MRVFHQLDEISECAESSAVAIGNFDGCHLGHQALLKAMIDHAQRNHLSAIVLTFFPHPVEVLNPSKPLERLTTASEKLNLLESLGVEQVLVEPFDSKLSNLSPSEFFQRYLVEGLKAKSVHVGFNFRFGKDRAGDTRALAELCAHRGIHSQITEPFESHGHKVSSSTVRQLIRGGDLLGAARLLGRSYSVSGQVQPGDHRGQSLGYPTANLRYPVEKVVPKNGVYVTRVLWQRQSFRSVTNVGVRPTFHDMAIDVDKPTVEVHLLDFSARLYDEFLELEFFERIRDEKKFDSVDALVAQIQVDVAFARHSKSF